MSPPAFEVPDLVLGRRRRSTVLLVTADPALAHGVRAILRARSLEIAIVEAAGALAAIPAARWREALLALFDVDTPGALDFVAAEERLGGKLFGVPLVGLSTTPLPATAEPSVWCAVLLKPVSVASLLRLIDREIVFEDHDAMDRRRE